MTDKKTPTTATKDDVTIPATDKKLAETTASADVKKATKTSSTAAKPSSSTRRTVTPAKQPVSKTALLALLVALLAVAGLGGGYVWHQQQQQLLVNQLTESFNAQQTQALSQTESQLAALINQQSAQSQVNNEQLVQTAIIPLQQEMLELQALTNTLQQNQPSDWLLQEAEYLIRIAARSMWLEKNGQSAINLLLDADARIKELGNPAFLPVRQAISQDIETLKLLPELATDDVVLKLMALNKQVDSLPIAMAYLPTSLEDEPELELSEDIADWRENLRKTWQETLSKFITVKRRTSNVEALLTPTQQQNLRQNIRLKLQLAQWAASQQNSVIFDAAIADAQSWLGEYFDQEDVRVVNFSDSLDSTTNAIISLTLPDTLLSQQAITRALMRSNPLPTPKQQSPVETDQATSTSAADGANL
ncbi:MAG: heme biosynthesis operon protein HemX [Colwelliaceae bacterium]|nr:heme biosynthesis operon protein HemX [Colwelliaceae bacterium]